MWNEEPGRASVLGLEIRSTEAKGDPRLSVQEILQRQIGRVVAVGVDERIGRVRLQPREEHVDRDALPGRSELRPPGHAVQIRRERLGRQAAKRLPVPTPEDIVSLLDGELPLLERNLRGRPRGEDRKAGGEVLPGRELAVRGVTSPSETRRD